MILGGGGTTLMAAQDKRAIFHLAIRIGRGLLSFFGTATSAGTKVSSTYLCWLIAVRYYNICVAS